MPKKDPLVVDGIKQHIGHRKLRIFSALCLLIFIVFLGHHFYEDWDHKNTVWKRTKTDFERCSLFSALEELGFRHSISQDLYPDPFKKIDATSAYFLALKKVASTKALDLDAVILNDEKSKISVTTAEGKGVRLLDVCKRLINDGNREVALDIGRFYLITQKSQAASWLETNGENGNPGAYRLLGMAHQKGMLNSIKDENKAFLYYLKAANAGDRLAKIYVSEMYKSIDPVSSNLFLAAAAEQGSLTAAYRLQQSLHEPGKQYFWSLVFHFIMDAELKKSFMDSDIEDASVYRWEGFPETIFPPGLSNHTSSDREIIENYNSKVAKHTLDRLERELTLPNRVAIQELFQRWASEKYKKEKVNSPDQKKSMLMI